jgi:hypothetical protein
MAYSKAELKSSGDKTSPCFSPFWIKNYQTNVCLYGGFLDWTLDLFDTRCLQFLITIYFGGSRQFSVIVYIVLLLFHNYSLQPL